MNIQIKNFIVWFLLFIIFILFGLNVFSQETATIVDENYIPGLKIDKNSPLNLTEDDVIFIKDDNNNYFHIYIKYKENIKSVLVTTIPGDSNYAVTSEIYGLRAMEYNKVNGDERRLYQGVFLDMTGIKYFLVDSTTENAQPYFNEAYHILVPPLLEYGYLAEGQYGKIRLKKGYRINIRTYDKKYADTRTNFRDNVFTISFDDENLNSEEENLLDKPEEEENPIVEIEENENETNNIEENSPDIEIEEDNNENEITMEEDESDDSDIETTYIPKNENPKLKFLGRNKVDNDFIKVFLSYEDDRDFDSILIKEAYPKNERFKVLDIVGDEFPKYPEEDMIGNIQNIELKDDGGIYLKIQIDIKIPQKGKREITITAIDKDGNQAEKPLLLSIVRAETEINEVENDENIPRKWTLYFDIDSSALRIETIEELDKIIEVLNTYDNASILIEGYTDSTGSQSSNLKLSKERAKAVKDYFVMKGINYNIITTKGYGEKNPASNNKTKEGRAENRRVVITLLKEE